MGSKDPVTSKDLLSMLVREFDLKRDTIEDRQRSTRIIYILDAGGMRLDFGWFKNGPYSQSLLEELYSVYSNLEKYEKTKEYNFSEDSKQRIKEIKEEFIDGRNARNLELMTSMHFMYTNWRNKRNPWEMKELFRENHRDVTYGDDSPITEEQLMGAVCDATNLIANRNYYESINMKAR